MSRLLGSPPRVREPRNPAKVSVTKSGITPACAGTTVFNLTLIYYHRDHPRVCGNHCWPERSTTPEGGSPPRVREPRELFLSSPRMRRITPACAGTTVYLRRQADHEQDHPRVCGNHVFQAVENGSVQGSPPRVREPLHPAEQVRRRGRITPACAGTTSARISCLMYVWDHPRVCGNHREHRKTRMASRGSPPRVREPRWPL